MHLYKILYVILIISTLLYFIYSNNFNYYIENKFTINTLGVSPNNYPKLNNDELIEKFLSEDYLDNKTFKECVLESQTLISYIKNTMQFTITTKGNSKEEALSCLNAIKEKIVTNENKNGSLLVSMTKKNREQILKEIDQLKDLNRKKIQIDNQIVEYLILEKYKSELSDKLHVIDNTIILQKNNAVTFHENLKTYKTIKKLFLIYLLLNICIITIYLNKYFDINKYVNQKK